MSALRAGHARLRAALGRPLARLAGCAAGVSAVEFALLAPVLVVGALSTVDIGMAAYQKMMIDQALRAGAQTAITGEDESTIRQVLQDVASENFTVTTGTPVGDELTVAVGTYCSCPDEPLVQVGCTVICTSGLVANRFYRLTASKTFEGVMLPAFALSGTLDVLQR